MLDVPTNDAQSPQPVSQNAQQRHGANTHEIEDIDRELEEYLKEKRSGNSVGFGDYSVDDQLSKLREKFGARATPTKESEKPEEVEVVKSSPLSGSDSRTSEPQIKPAAETYAALAAKQKATPPSHEELIRSLEEKYSKGESTNVPPQTEVKAEEGEQKREDKPKEESSLLADLKESIQPLEKPRVEEVLNKASTLPLEAQKTLVEMFIARFKRNKERMELYTKTQRELENELEKFVVDSMEMKNKTPNNPVSQNESPQNESPSQSSVTVPKKSIGPLDTSSAQNIGVPEVPEKSVDTEQGNNVQKENVDTSSLEKKYWAYLEKVEKKPVVLVYEPQAGFVRKQVDPKDPSLTLTFSTEDTTDSVVLTVFDTRGNELGVFKTSKSELDN
ncbi:MAG: hypothetical protein WDZ75_00085 [Candidatus Paceibacterota bacterium]